MNLSLIRNLSVSNMNILHSNEHLNTLREPMEQVILERSVRLLKQGKSSQVDKRIRECDRSIRQISMEELSGLDCSLGPKYRIYSTVNSLLPPVEMISVKRGGASYQVPIPVDPSRQMSLAIRWLIDGTKERIKKDKIRGVGEARMVECRYVLRDGLSLYNGLESTHQEGSDRKSYSRPKKRSLHRLAKTNRVFAHRRWR